jgi:hypothetical protein
MGGEGTFWANWRWYISAPLLDVKICLNLSAVFYYGNIILVWRGKFIFSLVKVLPVYKSEGKVQTKYNFDKSFTKVR